MGPVIASIATTVTERIMVWPKVTLHFQAKYKAILLKSETLPPYAHCEGNSELAQKSVSEVFGRAKKRKAPASEKHCQGFSVGATKTSALGQGRSRRLGKQRYPTS